MWLHTQYVYPENDNAVTTTDASFIVILLGPIYHYMIPALDVES
jgi:hypothetical protein